jgi:hypothetical protein
MVKPASKWLATQSLIRVQERTSIANDPQKFGIAFQMVRSKVFPALRC